MMNNQIKYIILIVLTLFATISMAQTMSEMVNTELQEVDVASSTVTVNGKHYKYEPNKKESMFRDSEIEPQSLRSLFKGNKYYFEIQQELTANSNRSSKQNKIIFISEEKLPE